MRPPTVCFAIIGLDYAGAEIQLVEVIKRLVSRGWRVVLVSLITPEAFVEELEAIGVRVVSLDMAQGKPSARGLARFLEVLVTERPDILHGHMVHSNLLTRLSRLVWWTPVVFGTIHSSHEGAASRDLAYRWTEALADRTTAVSRSGVDMHVARGGDGTKLVLVPNGIDLQRFAPDPGRRAAARAAEGVDDDRFVWLCVARFDLPKDHPTLLAAMAELPEHGQLWLVGQGRLREEAEAEVARLGLGDRVRFLGVRTDVPDLLCAADGFVLSSRAEAMPITLLEAGAAAVPVVSSDVGAARDLVDDGLSGHIVPPVDAAALRDAMASVMDLPVATRRAMGRAGRAWVEARYSLEAVVDRWESLYVDALHRAGRRRFPPAAWWRRRRARRLAESLRSG